MRRVKIKSQRRFLATGSIAIFAILALSLGYVVFFGTVAEDIQDYDGAGAAAGGEACTLLGKYNLINKGSCTESGSGSGIFICNSNVARVLKCTAIGGQNSLFPCYKKSCKPEFLRYPFETITSGTISDSSGSGNDGTCTNCPTLISGRFGSAAHFDGTSSVQFSSFDYSPQYTIMAWIKPSSTLGSGRGVIFGNVQNLNQLVAGGTSLGRGVAFYVNGPAAPNDGVGFTGQVSFAYKDGTQPSVFHFSSQPQSLIFDQWNHIAVLIDLNAGTRQGYINGLFAGGGSGSFHNSLSGLSSSTWRIGQNSIGGDTFKGDIDELTVIPRILSSSEIQSHIQASSVCPNGLLNVGEQCDDNDFDNFDGCSTACTIESGWTCTSSGSSLSVCTTTCGDGVLAGSETCDDSDTDPGDGCSATCTIETGFHCTGTPSTCALWCGDGIIQQEFGIYEGCDDAGIEPGDGCSATCSLESGWYCSGTPSVCSLSCGNGLIEFGEQCDDAGQTPGDGCSATCTEESGWNCQGSPSICSTA